MTDTDTEPTPADTTGTDEDGRPATVDPAADAVEDDSAASADHGDADDSSDEDGDAETFPRAVVERLRAGNARYRQRAGQAEALAERLHVELVRSTGRLADPTDLPFDEAHLDDPEALAGAVEDLLARKPHLAARRPSGDIGQGNRGPASGSFSLLDVLKART